MGLRDEFITAADEIFTAFADFIVNADYLDAGSTYSTITGEVTSIAPDTIQVIPVGLSATDVTGFPTVKRKVLARNLAFRPEAGRRLKTEGWNHEILNVDDYGSGWILVEMILGAAVPVTANP